MEIQSRIPIRVRRMNAREPICPPTARGLWKRMRG